jgi:hypothetical protein
VPTTLTGLLLFVVMLLPGFAYLVGKERHGIERRLSPFRETVAIVAASVTSELVVIGIFAAIRTLWPSITPNVGLWLRQGTLYLYGNQSHRGHYEIFAAWGIGLLVLATAIAYATTIPRIRRLGKWLTGPYPHESTVSSWWILFETWKGAREIEVVCILDDGSSVRGKFGSFNISADDSPDRDLILQNPLYYSPPGEEDEVPYPVSSVCIAARRIVTMFVNYTDPANANSSTGSSASPVSPAAPVPAAPVPPVPVPAVSASSALPNSAVRPPDALSVAASGERKSDDLPLVEVGRRWRSAVYHQLAQLWKRRSREQ